MQAGHQSIFVNLKQGGTWKNGNVPLLNPYNPIYTSWHVSGTQKPTSSTAITLYALERAFMSRLREYTQRLCDSREHLACEICGITANCLTACMHVQYLCRNWWTCNQLFCRSSKHACQDILSINSMIQLSDTWIMARHLEIHVYTLTNDSEVYELFITTIYGIQLPFSSIIFEIRC